MSELKITLVGAGSVQFAMTLLRDVMGTPSLQDADVVLMDNNPDRLRLIHHVATRLARELHSDLRLTASGNREEALQGAHFVVNAAAIAERDLWMPNREVARRHGYWQSKGSRFTSWLRQTPLALDIAKDVESICPEAWMLQLANPMVGNVGAISRYTHAKVIGLCHGFPGTIRELTQWMGLDPGQLHATAIGINHFIWIDQFQYQGRDAYPLLGEWLTTDFPSVWETPSWQERIDATGPVCRDLYLAFGVLPCNGDEHLSDYFSWYSATDDLRRASLAKVHYAEKYLGDGDRRWQAFLHVADNRNAPVNAMFPAKSHEVIADVIESLWTGREGTYEVNIANHGTIADFPTASCVEVPAVITKDRVTPVKTKGLPASVAAIVRQRLIEEELLMTASLDQDPALVRQALYLDAYTRNRQQVEDYVKDLAVIERDYLPWLR